MIPYDPSKPRTAERDVEIELNGELCTISVTFKLLPLAEANERQRETMLFGADFNDDEISQAKRLALLAERLSPEALAERQEKLISALIDWNLAQADAPETKLALSAANKEAVVNDPIFLGPLWEDLLQASLGARKKP